MRSIYIGPEGKVSATDLEAFRHYKKTSKHRNKEHIPNHRAYTKFINAFYEKIATKLVESTGGVFLDNFGYFSIVEHPKKQVMKVPYAGVKDYFNFHSDNKVYSPTFFGIGKNKNLLNFWVMDRTFSRRKVKSQLHRALIAGKKYKTYVATLASLYLLN